MRSSTRKRRRGTRVAAVVAALGLAGAFGPGAAASATDQGECSAASAGGPVQVTADCTDSQYSTPVIDSETDQTSPVVNHRVSGHFAGTDIQFNIYLPPASQWQGRFFQWTYPTTFTPSEDTAVASDRAIGFAIASGGYAVQAGNAGLSLGYRHDAAAAKFAKTVAARYYGTTKRIYGYLYGGSGGSYQTIGAAENTSGVWDGFLPYIMGTPMSTPYDFFVRAMARLVLQDKAAQIQDAVLPGGSGDPYAGLDAAQSAMLHELTAFGVPLQMWQYPDYLLGLQPWYDDGLLGFGAVIKAVDPTYVNDFWTAPGYLGTETSPLGDAVRAALAKVGDTVDNRWDIALRAYYRYQLPPASAGYAGFDQFRAADGTPLYPQRPLVWGPLVTRGTSGNTAYDGHIKGKVMVVDNLYDSDALPYHADWYASRVRSALGDAGFAGNFRIYFNDHADHREDVVGARNTYVDPYWGMLEQSLRDMVAWVENGLTPPASTNYTVKDAQILVPANAAVRQGIQPTVDLAVYGADHVTITAGQSVTFRAKIQVPPNTGKVVGTAWDFTGAGTYTDAPVTTPKSTLQVSNSHTFDTPGVYYVALRVTAQRDGIASPYTNVTNLDRVRVVVLGASSGR